MPDAADVAEQFEKHMNSPKQSWLLGAGISSGSNIPLMYPLTVRALELANGSEFPDDDEARRIIAFIQNDVPEGANIEHILTHLADFISMAERSRTGGVSIDGQHVPKDKLVTIHLTLLRIIAEIVRWGYHPTIYDNNGTVLEEAQVGVQGDSVVKIDDHRKFVEAIFDSGRAGLEMLRTPVEFFTTNYDTLIEDALALDQIEYQDGFTGGGVGFWNIRNYEPRETTRALVTKLHGSIDWLRPEESPSPLLRVRPDDSFPTSGGAVMIYPQATKYLNAQRDPFSELFQRFRNRLAQGTDHVLLICGYSFGDEHINAEIEIALGAPKSQLTIVAFSDEPDDVLPEQLQLWRTNSAWRNQVFVASPKGFYQGNAGPFFTLADTTRDWWTFAGVTRLFSEGLPKDVLEAIQ